MLFLDIKIKITIFSLSFVTWIKTIKPLLYLYTTGFDMVYLHYHSIFFKVRDVPVFSPNLIPLCSQNIILIFKNFLRLDGLL